MVLGDTGNDLLGYIKKPSSGNAIKVHDTSITSSTTLTEAAWGGYFEVLTTGADVVITLPSTPGFWCIINCTAISGGGTVKVVTSDSKVVTNSLVFGEVGSDASGTDVGGASDDTVNMLADSSLKWENLNASTAVVTAYSAAGAALTSFFATS